MTLQSRLWIVGLAALLARASEAAEPSFQLVANSSVAASSLTRSEARALFLKQSHKWPDGTRLVVVDLSATSPVRAAFSREVLQRSVDAVVSYWQAQIYSGRDVPPMVKPSDREVLEFVEATAGAVGYVASDAALPKGVKGLSVTH